ncbi:hypothetical protein [Acholeplasma hippikon]|uniref:Lipoprotein n=1 Tax=Acholeplasma hippikon TaxID=264636 RepID=A0A449BJ15_9MOLU|nr:hypothetical protein [Acholeplasma hippikon]VEU82428.1 Uncharacterised protein [Acholeplasma hippikon]
MKVFKITWIILFVIAAGCLVVSVVYPHVVIRVTGIVALVLAAIASFVLNFKEEKAKRKK